MRFVAGTYRLLGLIAVLLTFCFGILCTLPIFLHREPIEGLPQISPAWWGGMALGAWFYGSVLALMLFFAGESIRLGIDVEEDIRANSRILRRIELLLARSPEALPGHPQGQSE